MFNFLKKKEMSLEQRVDLLIAIFSLLPERFLKIREQLQERILTGYKNEIGNYTKFFFSKDILKKYEEIHGGFFVIKGIKIFNKDSQAYTDILLDIGYGIFIGYSTPNTNKLNLDLSKIDAKNYWIKDYANAEFDKVKDLFTEAELAILNPNDVYEVELNGLKYYHLLDLQDGDFIGIDEMKKTYKFTHDPNAITEIQGSLLDIFKT